VVIIDIRLFSHCRCASLYHFLQAAFFFEKNHVLVVVVTIGPKCLLQADCILVLDLQETFAFVFVPFEKAAEVHPGVYVPVDCRCKHGGKIFHFFDELNGHASSPAWFAVIFFVLYQKLGERSIAVTSGYQRMRANKAGPWRFKAASQSDHI
jgi:hypothetical protein